MATNKLLSTVTKQYDPLYKPLIDTKQKQLSLLDNTFQPQIDSINQAKVNAFRNIGTNAASRGVFYSGYQPEAQAQYVGETYTPAIAKVATDQQTQRLNLVDELNKILVQRGTDIFGRYDTLAQNASDNALTKAQIRSNERISNAQIAAILAKARL